MSPSPDARGIATGITLSRRERVEFNQTLPSARNTRCGVKGCAVTLAPNGAKASLMAFITQPGAPAVPASPA